MRERHKELLWRTKMESWWNSWELCRRNQVFCSYGDKSKGIYWRGLSCLHPPSPYPKGVDPFLHNYSKGMDTLATQAARKARKATTGATPRGTYTKYLNRQSTRNRNWPLLLNTVCVKMWEYCAPPNKTIYGARCASECAKRGKDYWWEISLLRLYRFCFKKNH